MWTDSTIALAWIKTEPHKLKTFVSNWVAEIQALSKDYHWKHVSSKNNPADLISRGCNVDELLKNEMWFSGPDLQTDEYEDNQLFPDPSYRYELKCAVTLSMTECSSNFYDELFNVTNNFIKLIRIFSFIFRFINNIKAKESCNKEKYLTADEVKRSTEFLAKIAQLSEFKAEIDALKKVKVFQKQQRNKWQFEKNNVAVGCLVLLKENELPPYKWAMARILLVIYGTDVQPKCLAYPNDVLIPRRAAEVIRAQCAVLVVGVIGKTKHGEGSWGSWIATPERRETGSNNAYEEVMMRVSEGRREGRVLIIFRWLQRDLSRLYKSRRTTNESNNLILCPEENKSFVLFKARLNFFTITQGGENPFSYGFYTPHGESSPVNYSNHGYGKATVMVITTYCPRKVNVLKPPGEGKRICQVTYSQFGLAIHQNDPQARRTFVEWAQNEIAVLPDFHKRILFSDEAHFQLNGYVNKQNCRIWSEANPQVYVETPLHPEKLTLWFQQDGATCHTAHATIDLLKDTFGDRLISRFGPVNWPPRSCDLTPLDYFLWGYVKSLVYVDKPQALDHLEDNIRRVIADIRPQMLEKVIENWTSRLDYIRVSHDSRMPDIIFKM
ncbi:DUF5641 domain-containing protein [Trichonephila clavipes]|uniref:DUF5641 domain-containing protein n=1 Tax=Trichonephila clavipes TaxID=2585209 RepID=A0A8X6VJ44_TRICX|nr:DUF5641 domain-containing protein [Trichonephila clavipes]